MAALDRVEASVRDLKRRLRERFEKKLGDNLYKLWNRMSSGSYVPPPVKAVPIPKKSGGVRILGIPTVADRIAQTTVKMWLEPRLARWRQSPLPDVAAGTMTGSWSSTSEGCSTRQRHATRGCRVAAPGQSVSALCDITLRR